MKKIYIFFLLIITISCSTEDATSPNDKLLIKGAYIIDTLYAIQDTFIAAPPLRTSYSSKLSVGKYQGFPANFLLRFVFLPPDTIQLDSARIELSGASHYGDGSVSSVMVEAYKVLDTWDRDANMDDYWRTYTPNGDLVYSGEFTLSDSLNDSIKYIIPLDNDLIKEWQQTEDSLQTGLYFTMASGSPEAVAEIASFNTYVAADAPKLIFKKETDSTAVWDTLIIGDDVTIFPPEEGGVFQNTQNVYIAGGNPVHSFIKFDLSVLPENILIYNAELHADLDSSSTLVNRQFKSDFYLRVVKEADDNLTTFTIDSGFVYDIRQNISMIKEDNRLQLGDYDKSNFGQYILQKIINGELEYKWFFLQYKIENQSLSVERILGVKNPPHKEMLIVKYVRIDGFGCDEGAQ
jgi:hypothetical protein